MKANPMETAPKDGRWIVCLRSDRDPMRVKWDHMRWRNDLGVPWYDENFIGWVEDIEPPVKETLEIGSIIFRRHSNSDIVIRDRDGDTDMTFSAPRAQEISDWLKQWH